MRSNVDVYHQSSMTQTAVLFARTISISAAAGVKIMDTAGRDDTAYWTSDQSDGNPDKSCGCLLEPPIFDLPPPPLPPPSVFAEFDSVSQRFDWINALNSDSSLESCREEINRWTNSGVSDIGLNWPELDKEEHAGTGNGDDYFYSTPSTPRFLNIFEQPLTGIVIITAASCVVLLSICLLAFYCRRKSTRRGCSALGLNKADRIYENEHSYPPLAKNRQRRNQKANVLTVVEGASPATTATILAPHSSRYGGGYSLAKTYDSADEMSDDEKGYFDGRHADLCQVAHTDWAYDPVSPAKPSARMSGRNGVNTRIVGNGSNSMKYGAIPTSPPSYDSYYRAQPLPVMLVKTENGKVVTAPARDLPSSSHSGGPSIYDSHNPVYEEISLHEKSLDRVGKDTRRLSERVTNYADSGASSGNSDPNLHIADEDPHCYHADGQSSPAKASLAVDDSPCCSSGRSDCDECIQEALSALHSKHSCPFSPRSRQKRARQDASPHVSPIRTTNKVNRSTQSGESCLGNDNFYSNACCECSGRESGYGTDSRCPSSSQRNRYGKSISNNETPRTADTRTGQIESSRAMRSHHSSPRFYTLKNEHNIGQPIMSSPNGLSRHLANDAKTIDFAKFLEDREIAKPPTVSLDHIERRVMSVE